VIQKRNQHDLMSDFRDEVSGYLNNFNIMYSLINLKLKKSLTNININMITYYQKIIKLGFINNKEINLLKYFLSDLK
jgi:hypothetical protein